MNNNDRPVLSEDVKMRQTADQCWQQVKALHYFCLENRMGHYEKQEERMLAEQQTKAQFEGPDSDKQIEQATRHNSGKPQYSLIDLHMLEPCVRVLEFGAQKYDKYNYKKGFPQQQVIDSLLRHIADLIAGKEVDDESNLAIIGHIQANALFLGCKNNTKE